MKTKNIFLKNLVLFLIIFNAVELFNDLFAETSTSTTFYIVRHGQTDWNKEKRMQGQTNIPLNDSGRAEAALLADNLKEVPFTACYSSDLDRAYETASIVVAKQPLYITTNKLLRERNYGHWESHLKAEFDLAPPDEKLDVESDLEIQERIFPLLTQLAAQHLNEQVLIATHAGVLRNLVAKIINFGGPIEEIQTSTAALLVARCNNGVWSIEKTSGISIPVLQPHFEGERLAPL